MSSSEPDTDSAGVVEDDMLVKPRTLVDKVSCLWTCVQYERNQSVMTYVTCARRLKKIRRNDPMHPLPAQKY